jgi:hypothetical protein
VSPRPGIRVPEVETDALAPDDPPAQAAPRTRSQGHRIAGVSGEFAAVARRVPSSRQPAVRLSEEAAYYSRYNKRYTNPERAELGLGIDVVLRTTINEPAYVWPPFLVYGGAAVLLPLVWCLVASPADPSGPAVAAALALLCAVVAAGVVLAVATAVASLRRDERLIPSDVFAVALGKTALMMVLGVLTWVASMAIAMM